MGSSRPRRAASPLPSRTWTPEEAAEFSARRDFRLVQLLSQDRDAFRAARRLGLFQHHRAKRDNHEGHARSSRNVGARDAGTSMHGDDAPRPRNHAQRRSLARAIAHHAALAASSAVHGVVHAHAAAPAAAATATAAPAATSPAPAAAAVPAAAAPTAVAPAADSSTSPPAAKRKKKRKAKAASSSSAAADAEAPAPSPAAAASAAASDAEMEDTFDLEAAIQEIQRTGGRVWSSHDPPSAPPSPARVETQLLRDASVSLEARRGLIGTEDPRHPSNRLHRAVHFGEPWP